VAKNYRRGNGRGRLVRTARALSIASLATVGIEGSARADLEPLAGGGLEGVMQDIIAACEDSGEPLWNGNADGVAGLELVVQDSDNASAVDALTRDTGEAVGSPVQQLAAMTEALERVHARPVDTSRGSQPRAAGGEQRAPHLCPAACQPKAVLHFGTAEIHCIGAKLKAVDFAANRLPPPAARTARSAGETDGEVAAHAAATEVRAEGVPQNEGAASNLRLLVWGPHHTLTTNAAASSASRKA
jgi:hypothetical protein